ncbi:hypothetical protein EVAR_81173_1 [Eumeta japonica]|uniref:Uncharacterized protein n=1 Tax=Eumeta variegata TaxID=151549 RepID=A0A4C1UK45_EUMVA|nr:hypothetical protein EVAR_81173_1 [Eumeta japonica]
MKPRGPTVGQKLLTTDVTNATTASKAKGLTYFTETLGECLHSPKLKSLVNPTILVPSDLKETLLST